MANSFKGKIEAIEGIQSIAREGKSPFEKRRVLLDATHYDGLTGERGYEKHICFEFAGKNVHVPDNYKVGDIVEIVFDVDSQLVSKKDGTKDWFTRVTGYKINLIAEAKQPTQPQPMAKTQAPQAPQTAPQQQNMAAENFPF